MKASIINAVLICLCIAGFAACKKKESGVCYCSYYGGNKSEYDLSDLPRSQQIDSCYTLDRYAEPFAGDCELK